MTEQDRFLIAKKAIEDTHNRYNIGTYKERSQHLFLKCYYEPCGEFHEAYVAGYIADILNENGITEIQTAGFRALHDKLTVFLPLYHVTLVYPVQSRAMVVWIDPESGEATPGRFSSYPKAQYKLFAELLAIVDQLNDDRLSIDLVYMSVSNQRLLDGYGSDRKKKATKLDSVPEEILNIRTLHTMDDIKALFPFNKGDRILSNDISKSLGLKRMSLWRAIKFLTLTEIITPVDKKGKAIVYQVN